MSPRERFEELAGGRKLTVVSQDGTHTLPRPVIATPVGEVKALDPEVLQVISHAVDTAAEKADAIIATLEKPKAKERWEFTVFRDENNRISFVEAVQL